MLLSKRCMGTNAFSRDVSLQTFGWASLILRSSPQKVKQEAWLLLLYKINTRPSRGPPQHRALPLSEAFFQSNSWQIYTETAPYLGSTQLLQAPLHLKICPSSPPPSLPPPVDERCRGEGFEGTDLGRLRQRAGLLAHLLRVLPSACPPG